MKDDINSLSHSKWRCKYRQKTEAPGYHGLPYTIRVVGCWAHARRKFNEALQVLPEESCKGSRAVIDEC